MADSTGPISSLPGTGHMVPNGATCDEHNDRPAVARIQGETDSFGSEMNDMCQECYDKYKAAKAELGGGAFVGTCDSCKSGTQQPLFPWRDYDEGMSGPVYYACRPCRTRIKDQMHADLVESGAYDDADFDFDDSEHDVEPEPEPYPLRYFVVFKDTRRPVLTRDGNHWSLLSLRDANLFVKRHKGKLRGRSIYYSLHMG